MTSIRDSNQSELVKKAAEELKKSMKQPEWSLYVKTGVSRERPPENADWWFLRAASLLRRIYLDGPVGVPRLRSYYGGLHRRGHKPAHFKKGSGKIVRIILQDLEKLGYVQKAERKGRRISPMGQKFLDGLAKK
jgi:small subunit ribosomal protein S19e